MCSLGRARIRGCWGHGLGLPATNAPEAPSVATEMPSDLIGPSRWRLPRRSSGIPPRRGFSSLAVGRGGSDLAFRRGEVTDIFLYIYRLCMFSPRRCFLINKEIT